MGVEAIRSHEVNLCNRLLVGLAEIPGITIYGTQSASQQTATIDFNIRGVSPPPLHFNWMRNLASSAGSIVHLPPTIPLVHFRRVAFVLDWAYSIQWMILTTLFAIRQIARRYNERFPCGDPGGSHQSRTAD